MELKLSQSSLPIAIFNASSFFPKHFTLIAQKWKLGIQRISWNGQDMNKKIMVHVVKEGETLTSISKLYGVPILEIAAANKEIADIDLVLQGQCLNIPAAVAGCVHVIAYLTFNLRSFNISRMFSRILSHVESCYENHTLLICMVSMFLTGNAGVEKNCHIEGNKHGQQLPNLSTNLQFHSKRWGQIFPVPSSQQPPLAKTTGSFLLAVPLIAFCISCIMGALQNLAVRNLRHKKGLHRHRPNSVRWKTALSDLRDPEMLDAEPESDSDPQSDDQEQFKIEDASYDYQKLEGDYQKFLSECGMSNWGSWRGGSPQ